VAHAFRRAKNLKQLRRTLSSVRKTESGAEGTA